MGNQIDISLLNQTVNPHLLFLTKWSSAEIARLFKNYISSQDSSGFYVLKSTLKIISKDTPLKSNEEIAFAQFKAHGYLKINFMELISSIITYSLSSWQIKVKLAFLAFDFDESKTITKDEMMIMVISFIKGIGIMTRTIVYNNVDLEQLAKHCFEIADSNPDGQITLEELTDWVSRSKEILRLFQKTQPKRQKLVKGYEFNSRVFAGGSLKKREKTIETKTLGDRIKRRTSISISFTGRKILPKVTKKVEKDPYNNIDIHELRSIFYKIANPFGYATVGSVYQALAESSKFAEDTDFWFHEFNFNKTQEIKFSQVVDYITRRRAKNGYGIQRGNIIFTDFKTLGDEKTVGKKNNEQVLKNMFRSFDKNRDGLLTIEELMNGLKKDFNEVTIEEMFDSYDKDRNHVLDYGEFVQLFNSEENSPQAPKGKFRNASMG